MKEKNNYVRLKETSRDLTKIVGRLSLVAIPSLYLIASTGFGTLNYSKWSKIQSQRIQEKKELIQTSIDSKFHNLDFNKDRVINYDEFFCYELNNQRFRVGDITNNAKNKLYDKYCN